MGHHDAYNSITFPISSFPLSPLNNGDLTFSPLFRHTSSASQLSWDNLAAYFAKNKNFKKATSLTSVTEMSKPAYLRLILPSHLLFCESLSPFLCMQ